MEKETVRCLMFLPNGRIQIILIANDRTCSIIVKGAPELVWLTFEQMAEAIVKGHKLQQAAYHTVLDCLYGRHCREFSFSGTFPTEP